MNGDTEIRTVPKIGPQKARVMQTYDQTAGAGDSFHSWFPHRGLHEINGPGSSVA